MTDFTVADAAIRSLHARYADAVWRKDYEAFGNCFMESAEWRIAGLVLHGRANIVNNLRRLMPSFRRILITFQPPILEVRNGTATGRSYVTEHCASTPPLRP